MARYPYQNNTNDIREFDPDLGDVIHFETSYEYLFAIVSVEFVVAFVNFCYQKNISNGSPLFVSYLRRPFVQARFPLSLEQRVNQIAVCVVTSTCVCLLYKYLYMRLR